MALLKNIGNQVMSSISSMTKKFSKREYTIPVNIKILYPKNYKETYDHTNFDPYNDKVVLFQMLLEENALKPLRYLSEIYSKNKTITEEDISALNFNKIVLNLTYYYHYTGRRVPDPQKLLEDANFKEKYVLDKYFDIIYKITEIFRERNFEKYEKKEYTVKYVKKQNNDEYDIIITPELSPNTEYYYLREPGGIPPVQDFPAGIDDYVYLGNYTNFETIISYFGIYVGFYFDKFDKGKFDKGKFDKGYRSVRLFDEEYQYIPDNYFQSTLDIYDEVNRTNTNTLTLYVKKDTLSRLSDVKLEGIPHVNTDIGGKHKPRRKTRKTKSKKSHKN